MFNLSGVQRNVALAPYTTFKIGGPADLFFIAKSSADLALAVRSARNSKTDFFILGNGSNILISDKGYRGLVIKVESSQVTFERNTVSADAGVKLQKLIRDTISHNLTGLEYLMGIPGTVGGAVAGNVGTPAIWIDANITKVTIINSDSKIVTVQKKQCDFSYRYSRFKNNSNEIIISATFELKPEKQILIQKNVKDYLDKRSHQPTGEMCAGSIFKNPHGQKAWQLIDQAGLRGKSIGGAMVSKEHANFIVNKKNATAEDVAILISLIKQQVRDQFGVQLFEEIKYIGFN